MKMEIPESVKANLRCRECDELLSCGPVFLVHETSEAICGRCSHPLTENKEDTPSKSEKIGRSRNLQYEAAAKLLSFPCRFVDQGCQKKLDFSEEEPNIHEADCEFRKFFCPIVSRDSCQWIGSSQNLSEHCRDKHPSRFSQNPFVLPKPDLTKTNLCNFLVSAFNLLFLIHLKVCVTTGKLFHSVRMFGDSKLLDKFSYSFEIKGNGSKIIKEGSVLPSGIMMLQEPSANFISINFLLELLGGKYNESEFTITILNSLQTSINFKCLNCLKNFNDVSDSKFCDECQGKLVKCKFNEKSCSFVDVNSVKCRKHSEYFCEYQTKCCYCNVNFVGGSFIEHLCSSTSCRETIQSNMNSVVRVIPDSKPKYILFSSNNIGIIICHYYLSNSNLILYLQTSLPSYELKNYKCSIELTDPQTKHTQHLTPQILYNNTYDCIINEKMDNFPSWLNIGIDIKINIEKT